MKQLYILVLKKCFHIVAFICRLLVPRVIHVRAGFDMDASHIFPQGVLATITLMGVWLVLKELEPIQDMTQDFLSAQW